MAQWVPRGAGAEDDTLQFGPAVGLLMGLYLSWLGIRALRPKNEVSKGTAIAFLVLGVLLAAGALVWAYRIWGAGFAFLVVPTWAAMLLGILVMAVGPFMFFLCVLFPFLFPFMDIILQLPARIRNLSTFGLGGVFFIRESVVVDDEGITHYDCDRGVVARVEWHQVREVAVDPWDFNAAFSVVPYATITGDTGELSIGSGCHGLPALLVRLAALPGFPSEEFCQALNGELFDEKKVRLADSDHWRVVVWRRNAAEPNAALDRGSI